MTTTGKSKPRKCTVSMVNFCSSQRVEIVQEIGQICPCILSLEKQIPEYFGETSAGVAIPNSAIKLPLEYVGIVHCKVCWREKRSCSWSLTKIF